MVSIERFRAYRRKRISDFNSSIEEGLGNVPNTSENTKAQGGGAIAVAGGALTAVGIMKGNETLVGAGIILDTVGITTVALVGRKADIAKRIIREKTTRK